MSESISKKAVVRHGNHKTAHIWEHFLKRIDLGKYHNNWRIECKHCRRAYDDPLRNDAPMPEIIISAKPKMIAHLKGCVYAPRSELAYLELEMEPRIVRKYVARPKLDLEDDNPILTKQTEESNDENLKKNDGNKQKRTHVRRTHTYQNPSTAHIWEHFIKRQDLDKYYNNWRVECKHCRTAYDTQPRREDGSGDIPEPKIIISAMLKMKAHLKKCPYIPPDIVLHIDLQPSPPKSTAGLAAIRALVPRRNDKCIIAVRSDVEQEPFWIACLMDEADTGAMPKSSVVNVTWLSKTSRGFYIYANEDAIPIGSIICEISLDEIHPDEYAIPRIFLDKIRDALTRNTTIPFVYKRKRKQDKSPLPSHKRSKIELTSSPQTSFLTLPRKAPVSEEGRIRRTANYHIWEHFTKRTDMEKYHSYWYVECNHCRHAYEHRGTNGYAPTIPEPTPFRSTLAYMQSHLDKCSFARAAAPITLPSISWPEKKDEVEKDDDNNSNSSSAVFEAELTSREQALEDFEFASPIWGHFIKRTDLPKFYYFWKVECKHCRYAYDVQKATSEEPVLIDSDPALMKHHIQHCRWIQAPGEIVERVALKQQAQQGAVLLPPLPTTASNITATKSPSEPTSSGVLFAAMTIVAVRSDYDKREFWIAQLGYDVTKEMLRSPEPQRVEVTWLDKSHSSGMYSFGADEAIPVTSILCDIELEEVAPGAFHVPVLHLDRVITSLSCS
ncbi:hypothetical protein THRCLA_01909 [Thraustotheca clavata]|uniref:BED-type domain-containing protein n=1 Tax=Thraustotheca clavata TaxID=74557 RepID=A0A1W0A6V8_9STRA|nr:hypothetical protein THRCLA_01909 [Thraustotheca clavata]